MIGGPTASGKTALSLTLAETFGGEIISADSIQVYRGAVIGSGAPTPDELGRAPHHLVGEVEPDQPFDAFQFGERAFALIGDITARGRLPIVVGGTGLYLRALIYGLSAAPGRDAAIRGEIEARWAKGEGAAMHHELAALDPRYAATIPTTDKVRVIRGLEIAAVTGLPPSLFNAAHGFAKARVDALFAVLEPVRAELRARLIARVDEMLARGLVAEATALRDRYGPDIRVLGAPGYREALAIADGTLTAAEARELIVTAHAQYAKRQMTWFRKEPGVVWVPAPVTPESVDALVARVSLWNAARAGQAH